MEGVRRRYSSASSGLAEDSLSTELHFVYLSDDLSDDECPTSGASAVPDRSKSRATTTSSSEEEEEDKKVVKLAASSPRPQSMTKEDKERKIEQTLEQWGVPKKELKRGSSGQSVLESSAEKIKSAVQEWVGSPTKLREAKLQQEELRKQQEEAKKERVRVVVNNWSEGSQFLHAVIDEAPANPSPLLRPEAGINMTRVLRAVRAQGIPRIDDISRMASSTVVKGTGHASGPRDVLRCLATTLGDDDALAILDVEEDVAACLPRLNGDGSTMRVARVLARATVAPLDGAMKDACPFVFNSARHSWNVRVECFPHVVLVTHERSELSAPGHRESFNFSWSATFLLRRTPDWQIVELFLELRRINAPDPKVAAKIRSMFLPK